MLKKIKIGATNTVGNCILGDVINAFKEINPQTEIYSYVNNTKNIEEKLLRSELDIAIIEGRVKSPDLISIPELNDFLVLICSARHPFAKKKIVKLEDLKMKALPCGNKAVEPRELFERYMLEKGIQIKIAMEGNSSAAIKKAVMENQL